MRTAMPSCRNVFGTAPLLLALLLAGGLGHNSLVFPGSPAHEASDSTLEQVTSATFDERVLKCEKPVLVDFYGEWCGPCKKLGPVLEEFAKEHPEFRVVKVNVDENSDLAARYEVKAMPSLLAIHGGKVMSRSLGVVTKEKMAEMVVATRRAKRIWSAGIYSRFHFPRSGFSLRAALSKTKSGNKFPPSTLTAAASRRTPNECFIALSEISLRHQAPSQRICFTPR